MVLQKIRFDEDSKATVMLWCQQQTKKLFAKSIH
jgi:hypothetical protein